MPTYRQLINAARGESNVLIDAVIKDHILGYLLAGISATPALSEGLVFKGGTALRKCWFPEYRYSEDLDFTVTTANVRSDTIVNLVSNAAVTAIGMVPDYGARYGFDTR